MLNTIKHFFTPPIFPDDEDKTRDAQVLNALLVSMLAALALAILTTILVDTVNKTQGRVFMAILLAWVLIPRALAQSGRVRLASILFVAGLWVTFSLLLLLSGNMNTGVVVWHLVLAVIAGILLGRRAAVVCAVLSSLVGLGLTMLQNTGYPLVEFFPGVPLSQWARFVIALILTVAPINLALKGSAQSLTHARKSEREYRLLAENSTDMISRHTPEGTYLYVSPACRTILGYEPDEMIGHSAFEFIHPEDLARIEASRQMVVQEPTVDVIIYRTRRKDGSYVWIESTSHSIKDKDSGKTVEIQVSSRDITERKRAEEKLKESEALHRQAVEVAGAVPYLQKYSDVGTGVDFEFIGEGIRQITGYGPQEFSDQLWDSITLERVLVEDLAGYSWSEAIRRVRSGENLIWKCEHCIRARDGKIHWVFEAAVELRDENGISHGSIGLFQDITARKQADEVLRASEQRFRTIFEQSPIGAALVETLSGNFLEVNPKYCEIVGRTNAEMLTMNFEMITHPDDLGIDGDNRQRMINGEIRSYNFEKRYIRPDQSVVWAHLTVVALWRKQEEPKMHLTMVEDITERRRAEEALRNSEMKFAKAFQASPDGIILAELESGRLVEINDGFEKLFGYKREEVLDHTSLELGLYANPADRKRFIESLQKHGRILEEEFKIKTKNGQERVVQVSAELIDLNKKTHIVTINRDITARKQAEERIQNQLERLNALRRIDNAITGSFDLRMVLNVVLEQVITQLRVDATSIFMFDPAARTLTYAAGRGFRTGVTQSANLYLTDSFAGEAVLERRTLHVSDPARIQRNPHFATFWAREGFTAYYGVPLLVKGYVVGVLEVFLRDHLEVNPEWLDFLETLAGQTAIAVDNARLFEDLQRSNFDLTLAYDATIEGWSRAMDLRDHETEGHTQRVTALTLQLARQMGVLDSEIVHIHRGALLHDIGKMGVPDNILLKPDKLTPEEWDAMRQHVSYAYDMLHPIQYLRPALDIPHYHHERWDGTGYPHKLKGEAIPLAARIFAVVDVWDAVTSDRPYRSGWSKEKAIEHIRSESGKHFDPKIVEVFLKYVAGV
jgi:PAS domain S-box-containing protein/putative nucleotidyltransferase with HDIG domain